MSYLFRVIYKPYWESDGELLLQLCISSKNTKNTRLDPYINLPLDKVQLIEIIRIFGATTDILDSIHSIYNLDRDKITGYAEQFSSSYDLGRHEWGK